MLALKSLSINRQEGPVAVAGGEPNKGGRGEPHLPLAHALHSAASHRRLLSLREISYPEMDLLLTHPLASGDEGYFLLPKEKKPPEIITGLMRALPGSRGTP